MPGRTFTSDKYRYGYNGQEKDNDVNGSSNLNTALFWEYDLRLARRWNLDPEPNLSFSNYSCFTDNPILLNDPLGNKVKYGDKGTPREVRKRIKQQVKDRRKLDPDWNDKFKEMKKDRKHTTIFDDRATTQKGDDGKTQTVTATTIYEAQTFNGGQNDGVDHMVWNIGLIPLPEHIPFTEAEALLGDATNIEKASSIESDPGYTYHRFTDDKLADQFALFLKFNTNVKIVIKIPTCTDTKSWSEAINDGFHNCKTLSNARAKEIKHAFNERNVKSKQVRIEQVPGTFINEVRVSKDE